MRSPFEWQRLGRILQRGLRSGLDDVVEALFPAPCRHCGRSVELAARGMPFSRLQSGKLRRRLVGSWSVPLRLLCDSCAAAVVPVDRIQPFREGSALVSAFDRSPVFFSLLHALKYEGMLELVPWFGAYLARAAKRRLPTRAGVLVPVPLHAERLRARGFNQSLLLARHVALRLGMPLHGALLQRWRATAPLAGSSDAVRQAQVRGAFSRQGPLPERTLQLVLVDDVVTTGATSAAAMEALQVPPERLTLLCLCRARDPEARNEGVL